MKVEKFTNMLGIAVCLIVIDPNSLILQICCWPWDTLVYFATHKGLINVSGAAIPVHFLNWDG